MRRPIVDNSKIVKSPCSRQCAIDWKVLKIIVVNKRNNVGAVYPASAAPLQIEDQPPS